METNYTAGKIIEYSWGWEQTNIDYYLITKRSKQFVTLQKIGKKNVIETSDMVGTCEADPATILPVKPIRRKVCTDHTSGEEIGIEINSYGWGRLWDGIPSCWSSYG